MGTTNAIMIRVLFKRLKDCKAGRLNSTRMRKDSIKANIVMTISNRKIIHLGIIERFRIFLRALILEEGISW
jgi:hypothetical protein